MLRLDKVARLSGRKRLAVGLIPLAAAVVSLLVASGAVGGSSDPTRPIAVNQTDGFGNDRVVAFTYFQNFDCVHGPFTDLDRDGNVAAVDPDEFQETDCIVNVAPEDSTIDPTGGPVGSTEPLFVIAPLFDADNDNEADRDGDGVRDPAFEAALTGLFGDVPDAFDPTPGVDVQCPEPGAAPRPGFPNGLTQHKGAFGTCTMHPMKVDVGPAIGAPTFKVALPNHSHIIDGANFGAIWWRIVVVFIADRNFWPDVNGRTPNGRTMDSVADLRAAQKAGKASGDIPTNFFLFFDSRQFAGSSSSVSHARRVHLH
jgi:hypothetical protein